MRRFWMGLIALASSVGALVACSHKAKVPAAGSASVPAVSVQPARIHPMRAGEELGGPNAMGKPGDWVIENDEVVFVVDALGGGAGFAESGGNVVDAADAHARKDELGQVFTFFGTFPRQGVYKQLDARSDADGSVVLVARGSELYDEAIAVVTEYRLRPGARSLSIRTTLENRGVRPVEGLGLGDAIQWGGGEKLAPGKPSGFRGTSNGEFLGGVGRFVSYAIAPKAGPIHAISGSSWTDTEQDRNVSIEPGHSVTYERVFVVGARPDVASVLEPLPRSADREFGVLEVALQTSKGAPVRIQPGAKVVLGNEELPITLVATKDGDSFEGRVPVGTWSVDYVPSVGRRAIGRRAMATVKPSGKTRVVLAVTDASATTLGPCQEGAAAIPCKLTIEGLGDTAMPELGPGHVAGLAKNVVTLRPREKATVALPHGRYRVTASRGPEYDLAVIDLEVPGAAPEPFALRRVVETKGYVSADFHQHSILSADAPVATRDRVLANAAEGVEIAVATEHNWIADLASVVDELGLSGSLVQIAGDEVTSDASKKPFGHANVYPLVPRPDRARNGAPPARDRLARDVFADARALANGPSVLQINHPRSGMNGYFDQLGFDPKTGEGTGAGYDASFDAIEIWNGRVVAHRTRVLADYVALLRTGHPATPIADTDTHGIVGEEPGYPRTFVRLDNDALGSWDRTRSAALARSIREVRDVVMSNGPFLSVSANGAPIGGIARARAGFVDVSVRVTSAPWVTVDKVELVRVKSTEKAVMTAALEPKRTAEGALVADATFRVRIAEDDALLVSVSGTKPMRPVLSTSGDESEITPWAMAAPIWVDGDGDGKALGR